MRLIYERGREQIAFPLEEGETYIGRKDYCEIFFPDGSLSKRHCRLVRKGDVLYLFDAGSRNGTLLNGEVVDEARLENGDIIQCGKLGFRVEGIPGAGDSYAEFELLEGDDSIDGSASMGGRSRASRASKSRGSLVTARAVASAEARPSMLDVLPELPPSVEQDGFEMESDQVECEAVFRLVEGGPEQIWELTGETMTLGSKAENPIALTGDGVSRYHAEVCKENGVWVVKDLGARNGIFIAGERVDIYELKEGDEVQIGTCKLRFEFRKPNPMDAINEVIQAVLKDPVGAFKSDPRVRMGAAAIVCAFFLLLIAVPSSGLVQAGKKFGGVHGPWLTENADLIVAGKYKQARDGFRKAKAHVKSSQQRIPRTLEKLCGLWMNVDRGAENFRWDKAAELIQETARLSGLPDNLSDWLKRQDVEVTLNLTAQQTLLKAESTGARAGDQIAAKKFDAAIQTYNAAIQKAREVDSNSKFVARAQQVAKNLQAAAYRAIVSEARAKMKAQNPNWAACLKLLKKANAFVSSKAQRLEVRNLADTCEQNRRDEASYMQAVTIVQQRDVERYPVAVRLLERVNRHSRVHADAQAYIDWIDADLAVRAAKRAYDLGNSGDAFTLLAEALQHDVLGPDARDSVKKRRLRWGRVVRAYNKGSKAYKRNNYDVAKEEFERVIAAEPNRNNRFHARSRDWLTHISTIVKLSYNKLLSAGHENLTAGRWAQALIYFADVSRHPSKRRRDIDGIRAAVAKIAKERRLLQNGERDFLYDRTEKFVEMRDVFKLLVLWLPRGHKDKAEARKLLGRVVQRLKNWKKSLRSGYPRKR